MGERARGVALDVSRTAIIEQGTWGAATGPVVQFNAPDIPHVRFSDSTGHPDIGSYLYLALRDWHPQGQKHPGWVRIDPVDQLDTEFARIGADGADFLW